MRRNTHDVGCTSADIDETHESIPDEPTIFVDEWRSNTEGDASCTNHMSKPARRPLLRKPANPEAHDISMDPHLVDSNQYEQDAGG